VVVVDSEDDNDVSGSGMRSIREKKLVAMGIEWRVRYGIL
jgi:hypothetical protein